MDNKETVGDRLLRAFKETDGTEDKETIAKILGYESKGAIYKFISGRMELKFSALLKFRDYTKRSIDWLLTGEEPDPLPPDETLEHAMRKMIRGEVKAVLLGSSELGKSAHLLHISDQHLSDQSNGQEKKLKSSRIDLPPPEFTIPQEVGLLFKDWDKLSEEEQVATLQQIEGLVRDKTPGGRRRKKK